MCLGAWSLKRSQIAFCWSWNSLKAVRARFSTGLMGGPNFRESASHITFLGYYDIEGGISIRSDKIINIELPSKFNVQRSGPSLAGTHFSQKMVSPFIFLKSVVLCHVLWTAGIATAVAVIGDPKDLPHSSFDFIIIGGESFTTDLHDPVNDALPPNAHCWGDSRWHGRQCCCKSSDREP